MSSTPPRPALGLAVPTIGRPGLDALLQSVARSTRLPDVVVVANQSGRPLEIDPDAYRFPVTVVESTGGASVGRNDAVRALPDHIDVVGFPNDTSVYDARALELAVIALGDPSGPEAIAGTLSELGVLRHLLPAEGVALDLRTVWKAIEPAVFMRRAAFEDVGGFRSDMGTGSRSPWQAGEGTDLLLRIITSGGRVTSCPAVIVYGSGERRDLAPADWIAKNRRYARGCGYVYRVHPYSTYARFRTIVGPLVFPARHDPVFHVSARLAVARSVGRLEGMLAHPISKGNDVHELQTVSKDDRSRSRFFGGVRG